MTGRVKQLVTSLVSGSLSRSRVHQMVFSVLDQGLSVGGMFVVNIALARTRSNEEYGVFALVYTIFTFLAGLHNAALLEAYTVHGSGRYRGQFPAYARLFWRYNAALTFGLVAALGLAWRVLAWTAPALATRTLLGLALACGFLLTASFVRRTFYIRRRPDLAAKFSSIFFATCLILLWISIRLGIFDGFTAFLIVAIAWSIAALFVLNELPGKGPGRFQEIEPKYWVEHWNYSRWVFVTALVFQLTTQGYYWLTAAFLSVKDVGDLRAMYNLMVPLDQLFAAVTLLILPMLSFRFASRGLAGLTPLWKRYCTGWVLITLCFAAFVMQFGKSVMHILYAGRFDDVADLIRAMALLPLVYGIGHTINAALKAMEKPQAVFYSYVASGTATFLVGLPLIIHFGLRGAVYGMLASAGVYTLALGIAFIACSRAQKRFVDLTTALKQDDLA